MKPKTQTKKVFFCLSCGSYIREINISHKVAQGKDLIDRSSLCNKCRSNGVSYKTLPQNKGKHMRSECEVCGSPTDPGQDICRHCRRAYVKA